MAINYLHDLEKEFDKYIRDVFVTKMSEYPPEYPMYTMTKPWPSEQGLIQEFIRGYQRKSIQPAIPKLENEPITTQKVGQGRTKDVYSTRFATGLEFTYEKIRMGLKNLNSAFQVSELLGDAMRMTLENYFITLLAEATNPACPAEMLCFDGLPPIDPAHVLLNGNTYGNEYAAPASVSYTVLHDIISEFARIPTEDGTPYPVYRINELWVPVEEEANALEVLKSSLRPDIVQQAANVLSSRGAMQLSPSGVKTPLYMPATMWFAVDGRKHTLTRYILEAPKVEGPFIDERTEGRWWKTTCWIGRAAWDWRGLYGVAL